MGTQTLVETRRGPLPVVADLAPDRAGRAAILYVGGLANVTNLHAPSVPGHDVVAAPLLGMGTPGLDGGSVRDFHEVYEDLIDALLPGRRVVACGGSTGAIPVLGLRSAAVRAKVAIDPVLGSNWVLTAWARSAVARAPAAEPFYFDLFGFSRTRQERRDYTDLLDALETPLHVVLAAVPLHPPRPLDAIPGMTSEAQRARLADHPLVTVYPTPEGTPHDWRSTEGGRSAVLQALRAALAQASPDPRHEDGVASRGDGRL